MKLVRDKIPQIILESGNTPIYRKLTDDKEYLLYLQKKLLEEVNEYTEKPSLEELVDILTVINEILEFDKVTKDEFSKAFHDKLNAHGGFSERIVLERVIYNDLGANI
jgi:predicted house-cleaning noncanonical NTP pyrophosphatase (MazG superfamily)